MMLFTTFQLCFNGGILNDLRFIIKLDRCAGRDNLL